MAAKYTTFDDYAALYPAHENDDDIYEMYVSSAEAYIDVLTHNRAAEATGYKRDRVKQAVCSLIVEMHAIDSAKGMNGARISSVSNDGYSETYALATADGETNTLRQTAMRWLSGTGLVSAL